MTTENTPNSDHYIAGDDANYWRYEVAERGAKVSLRSIGGIQMTGNWVGPYGHSFVGWAPLIKGDKVKEELLRQHGWKKPYSQLVAEGLAPAENTAAPKHPLGDMPAYERRIAKNLLTQLEAVTQRQWRPV